MAKSINVYDKQDRTISQFHRDAKSRDTNSAVKQALRLGRQSKAIEKAKAIEVESRPNFVPGSPAHLEWLKSRKK